MSQPSWGGTWSKYSSSGLDGLEAAWETTAIDGNTMACEDMTLADLDGDGRLDLIAAGRDSHNLKVYFNGGSGTGK